MSYRSIYGWGSPVVRCGTDRVELPSAYSSMVFTPVYNQLTAINNRLIRQMQGWRATVTLTIYNTSDTDWLKLQTLTQMLNSGQELTVEPRYSNAAAGLSLPNCLLDGKLQYKELAAVKAGQVLTINLVTGSLLSSLPFYLDYNQSGEIADNTGQTLRDNQTEFITHAILGG